VSTLKYYTILYESIYDPLPRDTRNRRIYNSDTLNLFIKVREEVAKGKTIEESFKIFDDKGKNGTDEELGSVGSKTSKGEIVQPQKISWISVITNWAVILSAVGAILLLFETRRYNNLQVIPQVQVDLTFEGPVQLTDAATDGEMRQGKGNPDFPRSDQLSGYKRGEPIYYEENGETRLNDYFLWRYSKRYEEGKIYANLTINNLNDKPFSVTDVTLHTEFKYRSNMIPINSPDTVIIVRDSKNNVKAELPIVVNPGEKVKLRMPFYVLIDDFLLQAFLSDRKFIDVHNGLTYPNDDVTTMIGYGPERFFVNYLFFRGFSQPIQIEMWINDTYQIMRSS
jgi:hypothetical protein